MDSEQEWLQQVEEKFLQQEEQKEEKYYQLRPQTCGLFFYKKTGEEAYEIFRITEKKQRFPGSLP